MLDNVHELEKISNGDVVMEKVKEQIITLSEDDALILCYDEDKYKEEVRRRVSETEMDVAREKALQEGFEEGIEKGIVQGKKEGSYEKQKEIALNLLNSNIDINIISSSTGLSIDEIKALK